MFSQKWLSGTSALELEIPRIQKSGTDVLVDYDDDEHIGNIEFMQALESITGKALNWRVCLVLAGKKDDHYGVHVGVLNAGCQFCILSHNRVFNIDDLEHR